MTQFLHPNSVVLPSQGAFQFYPEVKVYEENSPQALEDAINGGSSIQALDPNNYWVVEDVKYQVYYKPNPGGGMRYSAMVYVTRVEII